ncbi:MAG TPA: DEAD/DEAH box helicase [Gemmatimonadales bacterium]
MPGNGFHPLIERWFKERIGTPTAAQRRGWPAIRSGRDTLIAAPTGSGKTLAAFLNAIDALFVESLAGELPDEVRVVYVSPLKALSADIHKNLAEPRREIRQLAEQEGLPGSRITAAVRTGDTPAAQRAAMLKNPPHILVTTPESLYLLLTAERSRAMLRTARAVIVDEIHAVIGSRRGAHLALTLERLDHVAGRRLQRIGLSATQKPIEEVARFLAGTEQPDPVIVDEGHKRALDLGLEIPRAPLETVMAGEVWMELYDRLASLVREHRTTLVFSNTRRMVERVARHLAERLGEEDVAAHHGSLSKETRLDAEDRLKTGRLRVLVATSSLELGIDIGNVDLVCQLGATRHIAAFLQRVGRSGHHVGGTPKGRLFPLSRDDLVESVALVRAVRAGALDRLIIPPAPIDVLAQQIVAETSAEDWSTDDLYKMVHNAWSYRDLTRAQFDEVVEMVAHGFTTRRGRRGALVHLDAVNGRVRGRKGARLTALMNGGAIPDNADYRVVLEPEGTFVGTVNEDFAFESMAGDIFQLGNASWEILRVETNSGTVRVADAHGHPPSIPFWLGEAPARSNEMSLAVSDLRKDIEARLDDRDALMRWLEEELKLDGSAGDQLIAYYGEAKRMLGSLPTQDMLVMERFFDEAGGMQLILHAPFGSRVTKAWGLALRKRFCRQFKFELQAAATEDALLLSLGPQHSFPLTDVFRYLHPESVEEILVQALLDAPMFGTRWRWAASLALAVQRIRGGKKAPAQIQRMESEDLLAAVFPHAAACLETITGDREVPDHPLVNQVLRDCLREVMDIDRLKEILRRIHAGEIGMVARDLPEPSPLAAEILNARPYAFLDDAPIEERRTQAVYSRRAMEPSSAGDLGALDPAAIDRVREEAWPSAETADELHDALSIATFFTDEEIASWEPLRDALVLTNRIVRHDGCWFTAENPRPELLEMARGRLEIGGPMTEVELATLTGAQSGDIEVAVLALEGQGAILRGQFTPGRGEREWCDRRLLARIHRYTLARLRAEIEPVQTTEYVRFLLQWQHLSAEHRVAGLEGLASAIGQLDGVEVAAGAWESEVLAARCEGYEPGLLDQLCHMGRVMWGRLSTGASGNGGPLRSTPIALLLREHRDVWLSAGTGERENGERELNSQASAVLEALEKRGALFFGEIVQATGLLGTHVELALAELAGRGFITSDGFIGLRALITPSSKRQPIGGRIGRRTTSPYGVESAGRWSLLRASTAARPGSIEAQARILLTRWGVVTRRIVEREANAAPWRELIREWRRLEARGEIRGGRFVAGLAGEQFALPEAVARIRSVRRSPATGELIGISAADPMNVTGYLLPGERIPAVAGNRIVFEDGVAVAARESREVKWLKEDLDPERKLEIERVLVRRRVNPALRTLLGVAAG